MQEFKGLVPAYTLGPEHSSPRIAYKGHPGFVAHALQAFDLFPSSYDVPSRWDDVCVYHLDRRLGRYRGVFSEGG